MSIYLFKLVGIKWWLIGIYGVLLVTISLFTWKIIIPLLHIRQKEKRNSTLKGKGTWEIFDELLSGETITLIDEYKKLLDKDYANQVLYNEIRLSTLQNQINPHFLYNTLDSVRGLALAEGAKNVAEMTEALGKYFRYSISHKKDIVFLEDELQNLRNYFIIQNYRFSNRFKFEIIVENDDSEILKYPLPKLIIQPLVENAVFHGLERKVGEGRVRIQIYKTEGRLYIHVNDNGIGMDDVTVKSLNREIRVKSSLSTQRENGSNQKGIALINVNQRIQMLFGEAYGLSISSTAGLGTDIEIVLPMPSTIQQEVM